MKVELSNGDVLDRFSILQIKEDKFVSESKRDNARRELQALNPAVDLILESLEDKTLFRKLKEVNLRLWDIEDAIRIEEKNRQYGAKFVQLARSVYLVNDERASLKREINIQSNSFIIEEKEYEEYK